MSYFLTKDYCPVLYGKYDDSAPPVPKTDLLLPKGQVGQFVRSFDNRLWLFQRQWIPDSDDIVATLMIVHGTVDHSGVYHDLALRLNTIGVAVVATDLRGFGYSDGESYYIRDMDTLVRDVETQYTTFHQGRFPNVTNRFLLGKSIGGLIAAYACCTSPNLRNAWTGLIGLSGAFAVDESVIPSWPVMGLLHSLNVVMPKLPLKPLFASSLLTSDEHEAEKWENDPVVRHSDKLTVGYLYNLITCSQNLHHVIMANKKDMDDEGRTLSSSGGVSILPPHMLMLWGEDDVMVTRSGHEQMCAHGCSSSSDNGDATFRTYPGGRHNLLMEVPAIKTQVISDICDWIMDVVSERE